MQYHVDGDLVPAESATVSVRDRGFQYGDAAFETMRAYGGSVFELDAHLDRLAATCDELSLDHGLTDDDLRGRIEETLAVNDLGDAYVKLSVTRGSQPGTLTASPEVDPTVVVVVKPLPRGGVGSESVWDAPAVLQTAKTRKPPSNTLPPAAKTHNYLNGILARNELVDESDEALLRDSDGFVAEGAASNLFFVDDSGLHTPTAELPLLPGITRSVVIELAREESIPVLQGRYEPSEVREADEVFLTNTTWELRPVATVDGIDIGGGPVTALLRRRFDALVERRHYGGERLPTDAGRDGEHSGDAAPE
ncbi:aminotransferase class IV [Haloarchaeobius iranensis]|uniref:Branched-chain amino acid aminotransferase n=1 Tax=Haloarchaeobius iranensis TaxID=996166 RepID=A0A1G9TD13_9EURY|nr:aminotransferase class IV [Haloarchaeobius iranensis]SDM45504.1 branched-chain amino acid aminotransferase [Haloarchaeobius iranensis]